MCKATEVERKIRERNLLIDLQINLSSCRTSDHYLSLSLHRLSWRLVRNYKCISMLVRNFWKQETNHGGRKDVVEVTWCISP